MRSELETAIRLFRDYFAGLITRLPLIKASDWVERSIACAVSSSWRNSSPAAAAAHDAQPTEEWAREEWNQIQKRKPWVCLYPKKKQRKRENPCVCLSLQRFCKRMSLSAWHFFLNDMWSWNPKAFTARSSASKKKEHVFGIFQLKWCVKKEWLNKQVALGCVVGLEASMRSLGFKWVHWRSP